MIFALIWANINLLQKLIEIWQKRVPFIPLMPHIIELLRNRHLRILTRFQRQRFLPDLLNYIFLLHSYNALNFNSITTFTVNTNHLNYFLLRLNWQKLSMSFGFERIYLFRVVGILLLDQSRVVLRVVRVPLLDWRINFFEHLLVALDKVGNLVVFGLLLGG